MSSDPSPMSSDPRPESTPSTHVPWKLIVAGTAGNVMEWYDFAVYGYFASIIGKQFFPSDDPTTSLIAAFGVFAAGFLMRPIGGILFGWIGDHIGRKTALTISVLSMAIPTFLIGLLPTHAQAGVTASILLVVLRLIQGLSVGGEYTTSIVFLVESAGRRHRGFAGSWSGFGATAGILLGSAVGAIVTSLISPEAVQSWGWRLPFMLGLGVGVFGLYIRKSLPESNAEVEPDAPIEPDADGPSFAATFREHWRTILHFAACCAATGVGFYIAFVYLVTYMQQVSGLTEQQALEINTLSMALLLVMTPLAGWLSDRVGRRPIAFAAILGALLLAWPLFWLVHHDSPTLSLIGQCGFSVLVGMMAVIPILLVESSPREARCTIIALSYNLSLGLLGGTAPMAVTWLIERTGDDMSPAYYVMAACAITLVALVTLPRTGDMLNGIDGPAGGE